MKKISMFVNVDWFFLSHRLEIAKESSKRGIRMTVYADFTSSHDQYSYGDFAFLRSPIRRKSKNIVSLFVEFFKTLSLVKNSNPDAVHAVTIKPIILLGLICLIKRLPFIASVSGLGPAFSDKGALNKIRRRFVILIYKIIFSPENSKVICQSKHDANILLNNAILTSDKIIMTEGSGVNLSDYRYTHHYESNTIRVLMASRLLRDKGVGEFCLAAAEINKMKKYKVKFSLAGPIDIDSPGAYTESEVNELCESNNVEFLGNRTDLPIILGQSHIFVLPSYYAEGVPKVLLEAAASSCAVITTDHPGCRDAIVHEDTGLEIRPKDVSSLVNGLEKLLSNHDLIKSMGMAGRKLAEERFSIDKVINTHYSLYESLQKK